MWKIIRWLGLLPFWVSAQNYTAINGSSYIGSLNVHSNPAAIVNSPFKWDLTLLGIQDKHATNAIDIINYSLISNPAKSQYQIAGGTYKRYADINFNLNLLNTRIALNRRSGIAFGANLKSYSTIRSSPYNFYDTLGLFADFFKLNEGISDLKLDMASSSWLEFYASYARTVYETEEARVNAGITLKVNRGLSGAFLHLANGNFSRTGSPVPPSYRVNEASLYFGYSWNYDTWDSTRSSGSNLNEFLSTTEGGGSIDLGIEYLVKLPAGTNSEDDEEGYYDYDWKFGLSLIDLGYAQYHFGQFSTIARTLRPDITDVLLDRKFDSTISSLRAIKDSLSTLYTDAGTPPGLFRISHPTRLVLNVDKFISGAFFVNADLSVSLPSTGFNTTDAVKDLNLLTVTPRWETRRKGFYLPIYVNNRQQVWVGGAARLGPVLFGVHNWANLFSKNKMERGGAYLAFILKPSSVTSSKKDRRLDCPTF